MKKMIKSIEGLVPLTPKQLEVLRKIYEYQQMMGYTPTLKWLGENMSMSQVTIWEHINRAAKKNWVVKEKYRRGGVVIPPAVLAELRRLYPYRDVNTRW